MAKLKPCPFCGSIAHIQELKQSVRPRYFVVCSNARDRCIAAEHNVFGRFYPLVSEAIEAWNRRATDA